jgi:hypothetical protein
MWLDDMHYLGDMGSSVRSEGPTMKISAQKFFFLVLGGYLILSTFHSSVKKPTWKMKHASFGFLKRN